MEDRNTLITMWYLRYRRPLMICSYLTSTSVNLPSRDLFRNQWRSVTFPASLLLRPRDILPKSAKVSHRLLFSNGHFLEPSFLAPLFFLVSFRWDADARAFFFLKIRHTQLQESHLRMISGWATFGRLGTASGSTVRRIGAVTSS